jgi:hypothetical protein
VLAVQARDSRLQEGDSKIQARDKIHLRDSVLQAEGTIY